MRKIILISLVIILFCSCYKKEKLIQGNWIEKYTFFEESNITHSFEKTIFSFHKNQLRIRDFNFENYAFDEKLAEGTFDIHNESLLTQFDNIFDTLKIGSISRDSMILSKFGRNRVFEKLSKFNKANGKLLLEKKLLESTFIYHNKSVELEFLNDKSFISNKIDDNATPLWEIDTFENELFLVFGGLGPILQLKKIEDEIIQFKFYGVNNLDINLTKVEKDQIYSTSQFIGTWEESSSVEMPSELISEFYKDKNYHEKETLIISDSLIKRFKYFKFDEQKWSMNKSGEIIIFERPWKSESKFQWNIIQLSNEKLVIQRRLEFRKSDSFVEQVEFTRKK